MYDWPTSMDNSVGIDCGSGKGMGRGGQKGENWDHCNRITIRMIFLKRWWDWFVESVGGRRRTSVEKKQCGNPYGAGRCRWSFVSSVWPTPTGREGMCDGVGTERLRIRLRTRQGPNCGETITRAHLWVLLNVHQKITEGFSLILLLLLVCLSF